MLAILATIFVIILLPFVYGYLNRLKYKSVSKIPGPPEFLIFGNLLEFGSSIAGKRRLVNFLL